MATKGHIPGKRAAIKALTPNHIKDFHEKYYIAENATVLIVAPMNIQEAQDIANAITAALPSGRQARLDFSSPPLYEPALYSIIPGYHKSSQNQIIVGQMINPQNQVDDLALSIGQRIRSNFVPIPLFKSSVSNQIRHQRGLTYSPIIDKTLLATIETRTEKADQAIRLMQESFVNFVKNGPTQEEFTMAKKNMIQQLPIHIATNIGILALVEKMHRNGYFNRYINQKSSKKEPLKIPYLADYRRAIQEVQLSDLNKLLKKVDPNSYITIRVGANVSKDSMTEEL